MNLMSNIFVDIGIRGVNLMIVLFAALLYNSFMSSISVLRVCFRIFLPKGNRQKTITFWCHWLKEPDFFTTVPSLPHTTSAVLHELLTKH